MMGTDSSNWDIFKHCGTATDPATLVVLILI